MAESGNPGGLDAGDSSFGGRTVAGHSEEPASPAKSGTRHDRPRAITALTGRWPLAVSQSAFPYGNGTGLRQEQRVTVHRPDALPLLKVKGAPSGELRQQMIPFVFHLSRRSGDWRHLANRADLAAVEFVTA